MIMYHIDRWGSLRKGMVVSNFEYEKENGSFSFMAEKLFDGRISNHGDHYLGDSTPETAPNCTESMIEFQMELIRRCFFENVPSRYHSFFLCDSINNVKEWLSRLEYPTCKIWKVEVDENRIFKFDSNLIPELFYNPEILHYSPSAFFESAYKYWNQDMTKNPLVEYITDSPVTVSQEMHHVHL